MIDNDSTQCKLNIEWEHIENLMWKRSPECVLNMLVHMLKNENRTNI